MTHVREPSSSFGDKQKFFDDAQQPELFWGEVLLSCAESAFPLVSQWLKRLPATTVPFFVVGVVGAGRTGFRMGLWGIFSGACIFA